VVAGPDTADKQADKSPPFDTQADTADTHVDKSPTFGKLLQPDATNEQVDEAPPRFTQSDTADTADTHLDKSDKSPPSVRALQSDKADKQVDKSPPVFSQSNAVDTQDCPLFGKRLQPVIAKQAVKGLFFLKQSVTVDTHVNTFRPINGKLLQPDTIAGTRA